MTDGGSTNAAVAPFPFDAVVGHDDAKIALQLAAIDPLIGGVLLRGQKGSAKTTLARGLAALLGEAPFVELPLGATEDRVIGTLDTRAALAGGDIRFDPGLLAAADGGVLYVDEINLLSDHLVDVLLDVAASGENRVERDGISRRHAARFVLVGSMNPEEGELRPQLLDRFGLCVTITAPDDIALRTEAVRRRLAFDRGDRPLSALASAPAFADIAPAAVDDEVITASTRLAVEVGTEGLRADLAVCRAAACLAGYEGRDRTTVADVRRVAPLVLAHRGRRTPFDPPVLPPEAIDDALRQALDDPPASDSNGPPHEDDDSNSDGDDSDHDDSDHDDRDHDDRDGDGKAARSVVERPLSIGAALRLADADRPRPVASSRGRVVGDAPAGPHDAIAIVPTARRLAATGDRADAGATGALRTAVRHARPRRTVVLCVDLSGSMGAVERAEAASGTVLGLLSGAYERRDQVALVTFRGAGADVVLSPTASVEVARHRLDGLVTGGETPLAEGLAAALAVARRVRAPDHDVLLAVLTDGRASGTADAFERAVDESAAIRRAGVSAMVLDCETGTVRLGLTARLAEAMAARVIRVEPGAADTIATALAS